ncbi:hypothetical protein QBC45DRAFT_42265 [Copromyces sp. CBS 386.78]|nr:hypothetical protein QBC45DRAFT_42265 [Copromyces sp. CBS 386.78]
MGFTRGMGILNSAQQSKIQTCGSNVVVLVGHFRMHYRLLRSFRFYMEVFFEHQPHLQLLWTLDTLGIATYPKLPLEEGAISVRAWKKLPSFTSISCPINTSLFPINFIGHRQTSNLTTRRPCSHISTFLGIKVYLDLSRSSMVFFLLFFLHFLQLILIDYLFSFTKSTLRNRSHIIHLQRTCHHKALIAEKPTSFRWHNSVILFHCAMNLLM